MSNGIAATGASTPDTDGGYGVEDVNSAGETEVLVGASRTSSVLIRAGDGNSGTIYIGFDDDVSSSNGMFLSSGESLSIDVDNSESPIFFTGDNAGDEVRYLFTV